MKVERTERQSRDLYDAAVGHFPGGVNSPVRAMRSVGREFPLFLAEAAGADVTDADGNRYVDLVGSWGPMIVGHAHPDVVAAVRDAMGRGSSFGAPTQGESDLAVRVRRVYPQLELMRFVSSGTEASMSAIRLARSHTGRDQVLKFAGCYHGHVDALLAEAGSGLATLGIPSSPGVPAAVTAGTIVVPFNDDDALDRAFAAHGADLACAIVEGVPGNMGVVPPTRGFLERLQERCRAAGACFVLDDVMSGFRVAPGGAVELYGLDPDLIVLGKILGGGLPAAAFGGRRQIMELLAPLGATYQAGTLSGNPLAMAAGCTTLDLLQAPGAYQRLDEASARLATGLADAAGDGHCVQRVGSMVTLFFRPGPVRSFAEAAESATGRFAAFHAHCLEAGVYLPPSQFEASFVSLAHDDAAIDAVVAAARSFFQGADAR
jgi:glutamate-1-semialdehyde 2,1-aminomutase